MPDAIRRIEFDVRTPLNQPALRAQVQAALARGLPELGYAPKRRERLRLVANGPSAVDAPFDAAPTAAVNNALRLCLDRGRAPNFWIGCDPQPVVAEFLRGAPRQTTYLVASKCHPDVFEALRDRNVVLWHCAEATTLDLFVGRLVIPTSVSVTLCALNLMPVLGYERIETWGWDGCYMRGRDHAVAQSHHGDDVMIELGRRRRFRTTTSWACEAEDAVRLFEGAARKVRVRGRGMIGAILRSYGLAA